MANDIGIIILAGGKSSRMGEDKGLITVNNQAIVQYILNTCKSISDSILIVTNNEQYQQFGYSIVKDKIKNIGPIGGLYSGLLASHHQFNLVISCDAPAVSVDLLQLLATKIANGKDVVISKYGSQHHPLIGLYSKSIIDVIQDLIEKQTYKLSKIYENDRAMVIDFSHFPAKEFLNLNTKSDLETFKKIANEG